MKKSSESKQMNGCRASRLNRRSFQTIIVAFAAGTLISCLPMMAQNPVIVQGFFESNSGEQLLNPNNQANFASTVLPLINPCPGNTADYQGTNCSWPITQTETNQWPEPQLSFSVEAPYNTAAYNVTWKMVAKYTDPCAAKNCAPGVVTPDVLTFSSTLPGDQSWDPLLSSSMPPNTEYAGDIAVQAQVKPANSCSNGVTGTLTFHVFGVNQDKQAQLKFAVAEWDSTNLGGGGWFLPNLLAVESGGFQFGSLTRSGFQSGNHPMFGPPDGNGLMQVDRKVNPGYYANNNEDPYWDFMMNLADGTNILANKQQSSASPCNTNLGEVTNSTCTQFAYDFWDRQVYQACQHAHGTTKNITPQRNGGIGTETCDLAIPHPAYPAGAPTLTYCTSALSWSDTNPSLHFQDFNWIQSFNGTPCGYFLVWDTGTASWVFHTNTCPGFGNYVVSVCQRPPAYN